MGYRMRTANWSITEWVEWDGSKLRPNWNAPVGVELYDHTSDDGKSLRCRCAHSASLEAYSAYVCRLLPLFLLGMGSVAFDNFEVVNLADDPSHADVKRQLLDKLHTEVEKWITPVNPPLASPWQQ
jgi:hypothetical protein